MHRQLLSSKYLLFSQRQSICTQMATSLQFPPWLLAAVGLEKLVLSCRGNCCLILTLHPGKYFARMAGLNSCIYILVSVACKFCSCSEGMIMCCFKDGRILCMCNISWMGINWGGNPQTLSLCLTWIPIHSDMNRCHKYLSREALTFFENSSVSHIRQLQIILRWIWNCFCMFMLVERGVGRGAFAGDQLNLTIKEATCALWECHAKFKWNQAVSGCVASLGRPCLSSCLLIYLVFAHVQ